jgi:hypothetical protein
MRLLLILFICLSLSAGLIDQDATHKTKELYRELKSAQGKYIYYGEYLQNGLDKKIETHKITGKFPSVLSIDYYFSVMKGNKYKQKNTSEIIEHYNRGGIITMSWHMKNLATAVQDFKEVGSAWDNTGDVISKILPNGELRSEYLSMIDRFARDIKKIKIPIIFRPFHENDIGAFWWGTGDCTPSQFIDLWRDLVVYLRDVKEVHNLIYCYSPEILTGEYKGERFPGKNYIDIYAIDAYSSSNNISAVITRYGKASDAALEDGKVFGVSEGLRKISDNPKADYWTWYFNQILADPKASRAAFVCNWSAPSWGCKKGRDDELSFLEMSRNPKIRFLERKKGILINFTKEL